jgi:hypothetical protein
METIYKVGPDDLIATNPHTRGLSDPSLGQLPHGLAPAYGCDQA